MDPPPCADLKQLPPDYSYSACVREAHKIMFDTAEKAMAAAGITPRQVWPRCRQSELRVHASVWWKTGAAFTLKTYCHVLQHGIIYACIS